ncbi:MAG: prepilin-type N-terminal cleavage/methylation domain-containing protein [Bacillota bacterium]
MINNDKGLTLFELLISISVGSIIIMVLMSILTTTLVAKNEVDYNNRLNDEMYYTTEFLNTRFNQLGYRSIEDITPDGVTDQFAYIITEEFEYEINNNVTEINWIQDQYVLHLDLNTGALYYGPLSDFDQPNLTFTNPNSHRLTDPNITITDASSINYVCLGTFELSGDNYDLLHATCANAYIELNFELTYTLTGGEALDPRTLYTTLFF